MRRVAIPINEDKLSEYFGNCTHYKIYDLEGNSIHEKQLELPDVKSIVELPEWAWKNGITDIITYKIDSQIIMLFNRYKINLFVGIPMDTPENLINEFLKERMISSRKIITEIIDNQ